MEYLERNQALRMDYQRYSTIIIANFWRNRYYHLDPEMYARLGHTLETFTRAGKEVVLVNSCYYFNTKRQHEGFFRARLGLERRPFPPSDYDLDHAVDQQSVRTADSLRRHIATHYPTVRWVDIAQYIPRELEAEGKSVLNDLAHLSPHGARYLAGEYIKYGGRLVTKQ